MSEAPLPTQSGFPRVAGYCPMGCGKTLFLGAGGHVTCSLIECPEPGAADMVLNGNEAWVSMRKRQVVQERAARRG